MIANFVISRVGFNIKYNRVVFTIKNNRTLTVSYLNIKGVLRTNFIISRVGYVLNLVLECVFMKSIQRNVCKFCLVRRKPLPSTNFSGLCIFRL